ncbi:cadmium-exporting ATPase [Clostridium sp. CAG:1193]|nr:cadmium-exporting ATPase [Clostridium sp. CAG:1193]
MKKYLNKDLIRIIISSILFILSFIFKNTSIYLLIISYIIVSIEIYINAFKNLRNKEIFNENFLMIIATIGAFIIGSNKEAVIVMLLFEIGEYFSFLAVENSKKQIVELMDLRSDKINLLINDEVKTKDIKFAKEGDTFVVLPGEIVPLDGIVIDGESHIDTSSLTGESKLRKAGINDNVLSGSINKDSVLKLTATSTYKTSTSQRIIDLIENANDKKASTETFIHRFCKVYTPVIVALAIIIAIVPLFFNVSLKDSIYKSLVFLVTSCPCALVISVPLSYFCGIGKSSKEGILIKGGKELEKINDVDYILFDKTGTLTKGEFDVTSINIDNNKDEILNIISSVESCSIHPVAKIITNYYKGHNKKVNKFIEHAGMGVSAVVDKKKVLIGNDALMKENKIKYLKRDDAFSVIYIAIDNKYVGNIIISDKIKESSYALKDINKNTAIISGDDIKVVESVSKELNIKEYYGNLLPLDKVEKVSEFKKRGSVMFIGDGINDAPVLNISDVGVSMGYKGADAAIEASDVVIMDDDLNKLDVMFKIAESTKEKVITNISFALIVKFLVLILALFNISTILLAVFADVGVTFITILNSLSIMYKRYNTQK